MDGNMGSTEVLGGFRREEGKGEDKGYGVYRVSRVEEGVVQEDGGGDER